MINIFVGKLPHILFQGRPCIRHEGLIRAMARLNSKKKKQPFIRYRFAFSSSVILIAYAAHAQAAPLRLQPASRCQAGQNVIRRGDGDGPQSAASLHPRSS